MKMKAAVEGEHFTVGCCSEWGGRSFFLSFRWELLHYTEEKGAFTEAVRELLKRYFKVFGPGDEFNSFRNCEM